MEQTAILASALAALAFVSACGDVHAREQADAHALDADRLDAGARDAGGLDAGPGALEDAAPTPEDAWLGMDAYVTPDAFTPMPDAYVAPDASYGTCTVGGQSGRCVPTSACDGTSTPGYCPGPADIQCCTPRGPTGSYTAAQIISQLGSCTRIGGDYAKDSGGTANIPICQRGSVVWFQADMDIDCDGGSGAACRADPYYQSETSFTDSRGRPLDASTLPYIVLPGQSSRFRYSDHGIAGGQVALVLYNGRMAYGIFGDTGPSAIIGEASYAMAEALGIPSSPISGGVGSGVTYLVFTGSSARVSHKEDHAEAVRMGQALLDGFMAP